ncbi:MAG: hypothetical protein Q8Q01_01000 [archaeon]|nr:hypothetical protein [archaeon]
MVKRKKKVDSERWIFYLLVIALIITVCGTGVGIFKVGDGNFLLTGAATATGTTSVTVTATTALTNQVSQVDFGSGYPNASASSCNLISNGSSQDANYCLSFNNVTQGFVLENTGNTNVSLNWSCGGNCSAATLLGGTSPGFAIRMQAGSTAFDQSNQESANDTTVSCGGFLLNTTFGELLGEGIAAGEWICGDDSGTNFLFPPTATEDAIIMDFNLTIPDDAITGAGQQNATFTFTATASG